MRIVSIVALACVVASSAPAVDLVAPTEALSPAEQRARFKLPPGFEVQLVAAEPDIGQPMNLAFDARGRLWVTHSLEYPYAAADPAKARDRVTILSDLAPDGRARSIVHFADKLNIPIGVLPIGRGDEALVWSIPHIWSMRDTDGDGKADQRRVVLGPFDNTDTHGNQNAFRRGLDGWVYAAHGYRNKSAPKLRGEGEPIIEMESGHTYRFRPDGSAAEVVTRGQVNPFGLCFDERGFLYSADCHSMPIYQLIRGSHYPSFNRPHDGLGFAPKMIDHNHGSTGIGGIALYTDDAFPEPFRDRYYLGNVVTGRIHRDRVEWIDSTPRAISEEDLLTCDDPWFRPVDIQLGPDGALYVADFYNCIIGHYEVPLDHPRRDRHRGRIWRIVYTGDAKDPNPHANPPDLTKLDDAALIELLADANLTLRTLATHELIDRGAEQDGDRPPIQGAMRASAMYALGHAEAAVRAQGVWIALRAGVLDAELTDMLVNDREPLVRTHLARALAQPGEFDGAAVLVDMLADADAVVRRAAVESLARRDIETIAPLMTLWRTAPAADTHLIHAIRIAIREQMHGERAMAAIRTLELDDAEHRRLSEIAHAVPTDAAAMLIFRGVLRGELKRDALAESLRRVARGIPAEDVSDIATLIADRFADDPDAQFDLMLAVERGLMERGITPDEAMLASIARLVPRAIDGSDADAWTHLPHPLTPSPTDPWAYQKRTCADGKSAELMSSHPRGEKLTGVLRSPAFELPASLSFYLCGHSGPPPKPSHGHNRLVLRLAETGEQIAEQAPPRNDTARRYTWDLARYAGRRAYIEAIDGDTGDGYAWLAFGRFEPAAVAMPAGDGSQREARTIEAIRFAGRHRIAAIEDRVNRIAQGADHGIELRLAACEAMLNLNPQRGAATLVAMLTGAAGPMQQRIAAALASTSDGAAALLDAVEAGKASRQLLSDPSIAGRLRAAKVPEADARIRAMTADLPAPDARAAELIQARRAAFDRARPDPVKGRAVFERSCAVCHQIAGAGGRIGPSLDGIGVRGVERLLEDIADPNRNVDAAFRLVSITTDDGRTLVGIESRTEGESIVLVDTAGQEHRVAAASVTNRTPINASLMPAALAESLPEAEMYDLLAYLLAQRAAE